MLFQESHDLQEGYQSQVRCHSQTNPHFAAKHDNVDTIERALVTISVLQLPHSALLLTFSRNQNVITVGFQSYFVIPCRRH